MEDLAEFGEMTSHETRRMGECLALLPRDSRPAIRGFMRELHRDYGLPWITIISFVLSAIQLLLKMWQAGLLGDAFKLIRKWDELWPE